MHGLAEALCFATHLAHYERDPAEAESLASELIELSTRQNFAFWRAVGEILRGWARSASGHTAEGISWIENGMGNSRATGSTIAIQFYLALKAEALHPADRTPEALEAIREAERQAERSEEFWWCAELHRLHGVFLAAMGADEAEIEGAFCEAIRIAKQQKSVSLEKRAEATYAEYRRKNPVAFQEEQHRKRSVGYRTDPVFLRSSYRAALRECGSS
jgi:predicted ATPase